MKTVNEIVELYEQRKAAAGTTLQRMREIRAHYNGDVVVPLPELDKNERTAVANLLAQGVDQHGMRIASTRPNLACPPLSPGIGTSESRAKDRRKAMAGWLEGCEYDLLTHQRGRWMVAYWSTPSIVRPDKKRRVPTLQIRSPLDTFPASTTNPTDMDPDDCIFAQTYGLKWLLPRYPAAAQVARAHAAQSWVDGRPKTDVQIEVVEYVDGDELVLVALGAADPKMPSRGDYGMTTIIHLGGGGGAGGMGDHRWAVELERVRNVAEDMCPAVVPGRVTLDVPKGQMDDMVGLYQQQAKLMALEVNAVTRSVYPNTYLVARQGETPKIIRKADGIDGTVGIVSGGDIKEMNTQPGYQVYPTIDRLERAQRLNAGMPAEYGGESASNIRTDRRGQSVFSAVVDFPVQEAQLILARAGEHELRRMVATAKGAFGKEKRSFYVGWPKAKGHVDYTPDETFEDGAPLYVTYPSPGSDVNNLTVRISNKLANGLISKKTARGIDPEIDDPDGEGDLVVAERLEEAVIVSIETQANVPEGPWQPIDLATVAKLVRTDAMDPVDAVIEAQKRAQERQAIPVPAGAPEANPGLSLPGQGVEQPTAGAQAPDMGALLDRIAGRLGGPPAEQVA